MASHTICGKLLFTQLYLHKCTCSFAAYYFCRHPGVEVMVNHVVSDGSGTTYVCRQLFVYCGQRRVKTSSWHKTNRINLGTLNAAGRLTHKLPGQVHNTDLHSRSDLEARCCNGPCRQLLTVMRRIKPRPPILLHTTTDCVGEDGGLMEPINLTPQLMSSDRT